MDYILQDLLQLPLSDRLLIIEECIDASISQDKDVERNTDIKEA